MEDFYASGMQDVEVTKSLHADKCDTDLNVHIIWYSMVKETCNREKSLHHVAMVAKYLDDNKPKTSHKNWIRTVSNYVDLAYSVWSNSQMLA